jgi:hypothetical protein
MDIFAAKYRTKYAKAAEGLTKDKAALLAFYELPSRTLGRATPLNRHFSQTLAAAASDSHINGGFTHCERSNGHF